MRRTLMLNRTGDWNQAALGPHVDTIIMGRDFAVEDKHLNAIAASCPNLVELSAGNQDSGAGVYCTPAAVTNLASSCSKLCKLHLYSFTQVDNAAAVQIAKSLSSLQELTITGHDKRSGKVTGKFLRALAGTTDDYERQVKAAELDFVDRVKQVMRNVIDRERQREGKPSLQEEEQKRQAAKEQRRRRWEEEREAARREQELAGGGVDEEDEEEYYDDEDEDYDDDDDDEYGGYSVLERDGEYQRLLELGQEYFEVIDMEAEAALGMSDGAGWGRDERGGKMADFVLLDYAKKKKQQRVTVNKALPKREQASGAFIAPQLRSVCLEDQHLSMKDIKALKQARPKVRVFDGESCGSGYAAQMVYSQIGIPGQWY